MRYFSSEHIPKTVEHLNEGVPCPFCHQFMLDFNVCLRFHDLIDDVVFYCECDNSCDDTFYNFQTLEKVEYNPYEH